MDFREALVRRPLTEDQAAAGAVRENIMGRFELRVELALLATFAVLAGVAFCIHGLLFDRVRVLWSGAGVIVAGLATLVVMLNLPLKDTSKDGS